MWNYIIIHTYWLFGACIRVHFSRPTHFIFGNFFLRKQLVRVSRAFMLPTVSNICTAPVAYQENLIFNECDGGDVGIT